MPVHSFHLNRGFSGSVDAQIKRSGFNRSCRSARVEQATVRPPDLRLFTWVSVWKITGENLDVCTLACTCIYLCIAVTFEHSHHTKCADVQEQHAAL